MDHIEMAGFGFNIGDATAADRLSLTVLTTGLPMSSKAHVWGRQDSNPETLGNSVILYSQGHSAHFVNFILIIL